MEYFAFGETFIEEHKNSNNSPYKFNGKELDEESGLYYYGARYYDPRISIWASVDPLIYDGTYLAEKHNNGFLNSFNHSSYSYCYQNPVNYYDPNGKQVHFAKKPAFTYDSGFSQFPKEDSTWKDRLNYALWHKKGEAAVATYFLFEGGLAYLHYLGGSGKEHTFDLDDYLSDDKSGVQLKANIIQIAKANAQKVLPDGGSEAYYSQGFQAAFGGDFPYPESENWQKAIGAFNVYYKSEVSATKNKNGSVTYKMLLTIYGEDKYNFNPGQSDIATGTSDNVNGRFEVVGLAKEFMQHGTYTEKIEWTTKVPQKKKP